MTRDSNGQESQPPEGAGQSLEIAVSHLHEQLASINSFDGKLMFLTALNVAAISALIGITASADPSLWLVGCGLVASTTCVLLGLGNLWSWEVTQFPTPTEAIRFAEENELGDNALAWRHLLTVNQATSLISKTLRRKSRLMHTMLIGTPIALGFVVAAALTAAT